MEETAQRKIKLGISIGDPNGVGIELVLKVFKINECLIFLRPLSSPTTS